PRGRRPLCVAGRRFGTAETSGGRALPVRDRSRPASRATGPRELVARIDADNGALFIAWRAAAPWRCAFGRWAGGFSRRRPIRRRGRQSALRRQARPHGAEVARAPAAADEIEFRYGGRLHRAGVELASPQRPR